MSAAKHTPGPWEVDTVRNDGEYGSGPDTHSGFDSFAVLDSEGRVLFDTLNRDGSLTEINEEADDEDGYHRAWDAKAQADLEHAVRCVNVHEELLAALQAAETVLRYLPDLNTNWGGERPTMTTRRAERMVKAAIAKATGGAQ